mmetsp:Transcript_23648/g.44164  ORF Transcript_23648/g.44164 Transcript_23648/m.44164 type:complete len:224 (-) Transcript_23648:99-770(-)|eukprot:CAMPEP_0170178502 /NCGR_PEP_ID=MMETSP0040_2-20121228/11929_1 /TAXON_ID=641309 /ORGANISM="Lotharella oceanica, Strain CCMP622" /LENGTH=223 /DNA_ID=CAMNT_0010421581 /DNA_START=32 /DNA_END=703 /DNA_ORIENTATION=-
MSSLTRKKKRLTPKFKGKLSPEMQGCLEILKGVQNKPDAHPFLEPVDWKRFDLPDYPLIIRRPMDLGTIEKRIFDGFYATADEFASDVRLVWSNAQKYNRPQSDIYKMSESLSRIFERKLAKLSKAAVKNKRKRNVELREISSRDRTLFADLLEKVTSDQLGRIVETIRDQCPAALIEESTAVEIEVDKIDSQTLLDLNEFASECVQQNKNPDKATQKKQRKS